MAWKKLGAANLAATTNTTIYTVPGGSETIATVSMCNRTPSSIDVRLAIAEGDIPGDEDWIEYDFPIAANRVLERTGRHMQAGIRIVAYASTEGLSVVVDGNERTV